MPKSIVFDKFDGGIDLRKGAKTSGANQFRMLKNAYITDGKQIKGRSPLSLNADLPDQTAGIFSLGGKLYTFYDDVVPPSLPLPYGVLSVHSNGKILEKVVFADMFNGYPYVVAKYTDGTYRHHYFDEADLWKADTSVSNNDYLRPTSNEDLRIKAIITLMATGKLESNTPLDLGATINYGDITYTRVDDNEEYQDEAQDYALGNSYNPGDIVKVEHNLKGVGNKYIDMFYAASATPPAGNLITGTSSPAFPTTTGDTVTDGGVQWINVGSTTTGAYKIRKKGTLYNAGDIIKVANLLNPDYTLTNKDTVAYYLISDNTNIKTGSVEPIWTAIGTIVLSHDERLTWSVETYEITDSNAPRTGVVQIAANKVFAEGIDGDTVAFSATNNPRDWSTRDDAGFLPTGLQTSGDKYVSALGMFRNNLAVYAYDSIQTWTVDPDPAQHSLADVTYNVGSKYPRAITNVAGDAFFLTNYGVRSISTQQYTGNVNEIDVGSPIDELVIQALKDNPDYEPIGVNYQNQGQYMLFIGKSVFVYSYSKLAKLASWSYYELPYVVDDVAELDGELYMRSEDSVYEFDEEATTENNAKVSGRVVMSYLDFKDIGGLKTIKGMDAVLDGDASMTIGWDERDEKVESNAIYLNESSSRPNMLLPVEVGGVSFQPRIDFTGAFLLERLVYYYDEHGLV